MRISLNPNKWDISKLRFMIEFIILIISGQSRQIVEFSKIDDLTKNNDY